MGGRGSSSGLAAMVAPTQPIPGPKLKIPVPDPNPIADQVPDDNNTPVAPNALDSLVGMTDDQLAQVYLDSQKAGLPNHLGDVDDKTQRFVFQIGLNDKPMVLDAAAFNQFLSDNNIPRGQILSRSVDGGKLRTSSGNVRTLSAQDVVDMMTQSRLNYIGGKVGGQAYGAGTYFDQNGGGATGYGNGKTVNAVLNPKTARVVTDSKLRTLAAAFDRSHPKFARATGGYSTSFRNNNMSIYALAMGYNVIKDATGSYHNVIDRKALVYKK